MKIKAFVAMVVTALYWATTVFSQNWTRSSVAANYGWLAVASSADGNKLFAASVETPTYAISTNAGATWATNNESQLYFGTSVIVHWDCVASSADGNTLLGLDYDEVWVSTNGGISWASNTVPGVNHWTSVALSADGTKAVAVDGSSASTGGGSGGIYTSTNSGMSWTETIAPIEPWSSVASSADGTILDAVAGEQGVVPIYVSTNAGAIWTPTVSPTNILFTCVTCSADGHKIIAAGVPDGTYSASNAPSVYISTNSGATWTSNGNEFYIGYWYGVACSADGVKLVACSGGEPAIFTSCDSGLTWVSNSLPYVDWESVTSSADGSKLAAASVNPGNYGIYTSQATPSPQLNSSLANGNFALSWVVPSTNFLVQQSSTLTGANWCAVTNTPVLDLSNLQYQVALPMVSGSAYYRLKTE